MLVIDTNTNDFFKFVKNIWKLDTAAIQAESML